MIFLSTNDARLLRNLPFFILISYNNEGYLSETDFFDVMSKYGTIQSFEKEYSVFKGGNIKSNNRSNKVKELLFLLKKK